MSDIENKETQSFKNTLNLPRTDFPIRANSKQEEPRILERWQQEKLYRQTFEGSGQHKKFILHDGPPYANGHIHIGHAYNKILKDIVTKAHRMMGYHTPVLPGWDCHGLPIEHKVVQEKPGLSRVALLQACREYAHEWVTIQREEFKKLGVLMDWDAAYLTMDYAYEASVMRAFGALVAQGYIERKNKTVPWCFSCNTVLAAAEIEYQDRKDPSILVKFPLRNSKGVTNIPTDKNISFVVWTTTPWTLPLNKALLFSPTAIYSVVLSDDEYLILGAATVDRIAQETGRTFTSISTISGKQLADLQAKHPFLESVIPLIADASVGLDEGTAFVHCAPGAGPIDYEVGVKHGLEIFSPVSAQGIYTTQVLPVELQNMSITDGQGWVIKKLLETQMLVHKSSIKHSYPHCWRCHQGLIFRATKQWFCDLEKHNLKQKSVAAVDNLLMLPEKSDNRLKVTMEGRLEWCLSRQRTWGVPIVALLCVSCDAAYTNQEFITSIANLVEQHGIEHWIELSVEAAVPKDSICATCGGTTFKKEQDIIDVWFESGVSHYAVLEKNPELSIPADVYLEGKDQHRAWFQSSLLTSMALHGIAPMKAIITHGYTVDAKGQKMSKSIGNVVSPAQMVEKLGTDGLRLWACSIELSGEAIISDRLIQNVQEVFRKLRNVCRFLLSNLYDFDHTKDALPVKNLRLIDRHALRELFALNYQIIHAYATYNFTGIFHSFADYAVYVSAFYLDIIKDRLYVEQANSFERRSAQTACYIMLDTLTKLMAPIFSFTAEQLADHYQHNHKHASVHVQQFNVLKEVWDMIVHEAPPGAVEGVCVTEWSNQHIDTIAQQHEKITYCATQPARWNLLKEIRSAFLKAIEQKREAGEIKHSLEARVVYSVDAKAPWAEQWHLFVNDLKKNKESIEQFLKEFLVVSQVVLQKDANDLESSIQDGLYIKIEHAHGVKCGRCWQWYEGKHAILCDRCEDIVEGEKI